MIRNHPCGWAGFIALRRRPVTQPKRHGYWKHGQYSKAGREAGRELRLVIACLRRGGPMPLERDPQPRPLSERWARRQLGYLPTRCRGDGAVGGAGRDVERIKNAASHASVWEAQASKGRKATP